MHAYTVLATAKIFRIFRIVLVDEWFGIRQKLAVAGGRGAVCHPHSRQQQIYPPSAGRSPTNSGRTRQRQQANRCFLAVAFRSALANTARSRKCIAPALSQSFTSFATHYRRGALAKATRTYRQRLEKRPPPWLTRQPRKNQSRTHCSSNGLCGTMSPARASRPTTLTTYARSLPSTPSRISGRTFSFLRIVSDPVRPAFCQSSNAFLPLSCCSSRETDMRASVAMCLTVCSTISSSLRNCPPRTRTISSSTVSSLNGRIHRIRWVASGACPSLVHGNPNWTSIG